MPLDATSSAQPDGSVWSTTTNHGRQKRVMPSRSRRGGPGLGSCEVDILILETQRRKLENEPLIPADTPFLLTTNPKYANEGLNDSDSSIQINVVANERYFDRPDVLKAFREQAIIQTPEYEAISESISGVGGRFRPRNQEEALAETSDSAYEKRHRKFENFEKRQRYREKEKLKHEHYKLKERIEQLKAMDGSSFMTLPASAFTPPPQEIAQDVEETTSSPYVALNGGVYHTEGERRRGEMLDVAIRLEKRYAYLLPPRKVLDPSSSSLRDTDSRDGDETEIERDSTVPPSKKDKVSKPRLQSVKSSASTTPAHSPATSRPLLLKKSSLNTSTLVPEPSKPTDGNRQTSISTSAEPAESIPPVEEKEKSLSPISVADDHAPENDRLPSPSPPPSTSLHLVEQEVDNTDIRSPEPPVDQHVCLTVQNDTQPVEDVPMEPPEEVRVETRIEEEPKISQPQPEPSPDMADHMQQTENITVADKEPEKPPDAEHIQEAPSEPLPKRRGIGRPRKRGPGRPRKRVDPEDAAGPSEMTEEQAEVVSGIRLEELPTLGWTHSTPDPPTKRRRKNEVPESISAGPVRSRSPSDNCIALAAISATYYSIRGKNYVSYVDGSSGDTVHTSSLLMVACVRSLEKTIVRRARDHFSFGALTPDFGRGGEVVYELPEEIFWGDSRGHAGGSTEATDVEKEHDEEEEAESNKEDNDTEEKQPDEEETVSVTRQSTEEQVSNERDNPIEPGENAMDQNDHPGIKLVEQGYNSRYGSNVLVHRSPYHEELIASPEAPEAAPMPVLPPSVRPRLSRRHHYEEEEVLIWD